jgi:hypothetical protein
MKPQSPLYPPPPSTHFLNAALLLDIFDEPIVIQRNFLNLTGSLNSAMLLSWIVTVSQEQEPVTDGWLRMSQQTWQTETSLSRFELESARSVLRQIGLIEERRSGWPAMTAVRLKVDRLAQALQDQAQRRYGHALP